MVWDVRVCACGVSHGVRLVWLQLKQAVMVTVASARAKTKLKARVFKKWVKVAWVLGLHLAFSPNRTQTAKLIGFPCGAPPHLHAHTHTHTKQKLRLLANFEFMFHVMTALQSAHLAKFQPDWEVHSQHHAFPCSGGALQQITRLLTFDSLLLGGGSPLAHAVVPADVCALQGDEADEIDFAARHPRSCARVPRCTGSSATSLHPLPEYYSSPI